MTRKNCKRAIAVVLACALAFGLNSTYSLAFAEKGSSLSGEWSEEDVYVAQSGESDTLGADSDEPAIPVIRENPDSGSDEELTPDPGSESSGHESSEAESSREESSQEESSQEESSKDESAQEESSKEESSKGESSKGESSEEEVSRAESSEEETSEVESSQEEQKPEEKAATVLFRFEEGTEYVVYLPGYSLIDGVSAKDENDNPVANIRVTDDGGFSQYTPFKNEGSSETTDLVRVTRAADNSEDSTPDQLPSEAEDGDRPDNSVAQGTGYTVTYAAEHPVTGETFTTQRTVYAMPGIMPLAETPITTRQQLLDRLQTTTDRTIYLAQAIVIDRSTDISPGRVNDITIVSKEGMRHFIITQPNVTLSFNDRGTSVVLDGGSNKILGGGGIESRATTGTVTIMDYGALTIQNCVWPTNGGAISSVTPQTIVDGNLFIHKNGVPVVDGGLGSGGAIYASPAVKQGSSLTVTGISKDMPISMQWNTSQNNFGGGIYANVEKVELENVELLNNSTVYGAGQTGGGIWTNAATVNIDSAYFADNYAFIGGGAISSENPAGSLTISNSTFIGNYTNGAGGAIWTNNRNIRITNTDIDGANQYREPSALEGGALYTEASTNSQELTIIGGRFYGGEAENGSGGAVATKADVITIDGTRFDDNTASGNGGAVAFLMGTRNPAQINIMGATFRKNAAWANGGAISTLSGSSDASSLTISDSLFDDNRLFGAGAGPESNSGGAIYSQSRTTTIKNSTKFLNNVAANGGAIAVNRQQGQLVLQNDNQSATNKIEIFGNKALGHRGQGGGIQVLGANYTVRINHTEFKENTANGDGGGLYVSGNNSLVELPSAVFNKNTAENGGGLYAAVQKLVVEEKATFGYNVASQNGGGIYTSAATAELTGVGVVGNIADKDGGGIYAADATKLTVSVGTISLNTVSGDGGGIYTAQPKELRMSGTQLLLNKAGKAYWLAPESPNYLGATAAELMALAGTFGTLGLSGAPAGEPAFRYAFNNYDVNYTGASAIFGLTVPDIDFGSNPLPLVQFREKAKASSNIEVTDGYGAPWNLTAKLSKEFTLKTDGSVKLPESSLVAVVGDTDNPITLTSAAGIYSSATGGSQSLSVFNHLRIFLKLPANSVKQVGEYEAQILWSLERTP